MLNLNPAALLKQFFQEHSSQNKIDKKIAGEDGLLSKQEFQTHFGAFLKKRAIIYMI